MNEKQTFQIGRNRPHEEPIKLVPEDAAPAITLKTLVVEAQNACDISCPGCSWGSLKDQGWKDKSRTPTHDVMVATGKAINEYTEENGLKTFDVVFFGGEPCATGVEPLRTMLSTFRENTPRVDIEPRITTNGIRLGRDPELRAFLKEEKFKVAISLDGYREVNDRYRKHYDARGRKDESLVGTYDEIVNAITTWNGENPDNHAAILVTLHEQHDQGDDYDLIRIYDTVNALEPRAFDFLPNYERFGQREPIKNFYDISADVPTPTGDMLIELYNHHRKIPEGKRRPVRILDAVVNILEGRESESTFIGLTAVGQLAVSTKGDVRLEIAYNGAYDGASRTDVHISEPRAIAKALRHPLLLPGRLGWAGLNKTCRACPLVDCCGGSAPPSRYWREPSADNRYSEIIRRFDWPSAYCADIAKFILHAAQDTNSEIDSAYIPTWPPAESQVRPHFNSDIEQQIAPQP